MTFDHSYYNLPHSLQPLLLELTNHSTATLLQPPATPATTYQKHHNPLSDNLQPLLSLTNQTTACWQPSATPAITYQTQHNPLSDNLQPLLLSVTKHSITNSLTTFSHSCYHLPNTAQPTLWQPPATPAITYQTQHNPLSDNFQSLLLSFTKHSTTHSLTTSSHSCCHLPTTAQPALWQPPATPAITYQPEHSPLSDSLQSLLL